MPEAVVEAVGQYMCLVVVLQHKRMSRVLELLPVMVLVLMAMDLPVVVDVEVDVVADVVVDTEVDMEV